MKNLNDTTADAHAAITAGDYATAARHLRAAARLADALTTPITPQPAPTAPTGDAISAAVAANLRTLDTLDAGHAALTGLPKATLVAVATDLGITRITHLSAPALRERIVKQAITARRKFEGLRSW